MKLRLLIWLIAFVGALAPRAFAESISPPRPDIERFGVNDASIRQAARLLGYVSGQAAGLDKVARQHPELAYRVEALHREFTVRYSFPNLRARWFLEDALGKQDAERLVAEYIAPIEQSIGSMDRARAEVFLREVEDRVNGRVSEPEHKTMLWLAHSDAGYQEMRTWSQEFSSAGHQKAAGLNITLSVPFSWDQEEGSRPHVVSKWTSQDGTGDVVATLLVRELVGVVVYDNVAEVKDLGDWEWLIPDGFEFRDGTAVEIDRQPGLRVDSKGARRSLDTVIKLRSRTYTIFPPNRMVQLSCMLGSTPGGDAGLLEFRMREVRQTCRQIAASITFPDTYR